MTKTQRFGILFLVAGLFIVICVVLVWLLVPLTFTPPGITAIDVDSTLPVTSSHALLPYYPSPATVPAEIASLESPSNQFKENSQQEMDNKNKGDSPEWNMIPYTEALALSADKRSRSVRSFRLAIPSLGIDAPVEPVSQVELQDANGKFFRQWSVPNRYAVGWHKNSAPPGHSGNTVINGHNNVHGAIFKDLVDLTLGEKIILYTEDQEHIYQVIHREFLLERGEPLRERLRNARWILPSEDVRLTIVTCWPNTTNSHRLVVIAQPLQSEPDF